MLSSQLRWYQSCPNTINEHLMRAALTNEPCVSRMYKPHRARRSSRISKRRCTVKSCCTNLLKNKYNLVVLSSPEKSTPPLIGYPVRCYHRNCVGISWIRTQSTSILSVHESCPQRNLHKGPAWQPCTSCIEQGDLQLSIQMKPF
jgi:hypothetical protein